MKEIKILTPVGMLGYGFPEDDFRRGLEKNPDAVILDSGSTDPGPYMLGNGQTLVKPRAYERDLKIILSGLINRKIPLLIGSAGGAGSSGNVDYIIETISAICNELGIHRKIVAIYSDVDSKIVKERFHQGRIKSCSSAPDLTDKDIDESVRIVAQMGAEPILKALQDNPDADIIVAGRAYDPSPYAAYCMYRGIENSGIYWHMGKIMECGAFCCEQKGQVILATVREDSFDLEPMDPKNRCTEVSVAAHTLYEKTRPDLLPGPGGVLNLQKSHYEQLTDRVVRVGGSVFEKSPVYQVKLEGASVVGYRTTFIGGVRDPILISQLDSFLENVRVRLSSLYQELTTREAKLFFHIYGRNGVMEEQEPVKDYKPIEVGILGEVVAKTQELANAICSNARIGVLHLPYPGQIATGGNLALPLNPPDNPIGPVCRFSIYHLMEVESPLELFTMRTMEV